jgi:hypothetical protein
MKIGTILHRRVRAGFAETVWKYEVIGEILRELGGFTNGDRTACIIVRCMECRDHTLCELLVTKTHCGNFVYVEMINEEEDEEPQYYWHDEKKSLFYISEADAKKEVLRQLTFNLKENIEAEKKHIIRHQKEIDRLTLVLKGLK